MLLVFMAVAVTITTAATTITLINSTTTSRVEQGQMAYNIAESGIENALIRLLRDPGYSGETLPVAEGFATISVTGTPLMTITSTGVLGDFTRRLQATAQFVSGVLNILSWQEVY